MGQATALSSPSFAVLANQSQPQQVPKRTKRESSEKATNPIIPPSDDGQTCVCTLRKRRTFSAFASPYVGNVGVPDYIILSTMQLCRCLPTSDHIPVPRCRLHSRVAGIIVQGCQQRYNPSFLPTDITMAEIKIDQDMLGSVNGKVVVLAGMRTTLILMMPPNPCLTS